MHVAPPPLLLAPPPVALTPLALQPSAAGAISSGIDPRAPGALASLPLQLVSLRVAVYTAQAQTQVIRAQDAMLGTLVDLRA